MILLADSGSTKTDWVLINNGIVTDTVRTVGFNPYFVDSDQVFNALKHEFPHQLPIKEIKLVCFYGTGCSSPENNLIISSAMGRLFCGATIDVQHDLLGSARALFGRERGIAAILGTGSNTCLYDGNEITDSLFSLGYLFGDEGSGDNLGKTYLTLHLKKRVPEEIYQCFHESYPYSPEDILTHVYKKPHPNRFLASFSIFLKQNLHHPFVEELVLQCFDDFFREQVTIYPQYRDHTVSFTGSVGFYFSEQVKKAASAYGVSTGKFLLSPLEGLTDYHKNQYC